MRKCIIYLNVNYHLPWLSSKCISRLTTFSLAFNRCCIFYRRHKFCDVQIYVWALTRTRNFSISNNGNADTRRKRYHRYCINTVILYINYTNVFWNVFYRIPYKLLEYTKFCRWNTILLLLFTEYSLHMYGRRSVSAKYIWRSAPASHITLVNLPNVTAYACTTHAPQVAY